VGAGSDTPPPSAGLANVCVEVPALAAEHAATASPTRTTALLPKLLSITILRFLLLA
jgi:hypothetical protein